MGPWIKPSVELVERFGEAVAGIDGLEVRKMFGYPTGFIGGNMTAGLFAETMIVRLAEGERDERRAVGWSQFEPMPGRRMREYVVLPPDVAANPEEARAWVERAATYVRTLPPKQPKVRKQSSAKKASKPG